MNYRHAYHAGNHADVLKHIVLARAIERLIQKDKPLRFIDAHAGIGLYDLSGPEAMKTLEWRDGIGKLDDRFDAGVEELLTGYRRITHKLAAIHRYPGSPWIAANLLRPVDRLVLNELHSVDSDTLVKVFAADNRIAVTGVDAAICIKANLPPPERRGLILIDPAYEQRDDAERVLRLLRQGLHRFATGCFIVWYPLKAGDVAARLCTGAAGLQPKNILRIELQVRESFEAGGLAGSGLIVVNPPWQLDQDLKTITPALAGRLGRGSWGRAGVEWLAPPG